MKNITSENLRWVGNKKFFNILGERYGTIIPKFVALIFEL